VFKRPVPASRVTVRPFAWVAYQENPSSEDCPGRFGTFPGNRSHFCLRNHVPLTVWNPETSISLRGILDGRSRLRRVWSSSERPAPAVPPGWQDAGEFLAATSCLGVSHPSGQPLYHLLGKLFLDLPLGPPAWRLGLMSAAAAALGLSSSCDWPVSSPPCQFIGSY